MKISILIYYLLASFGSFCQLTVTLLPAPEGMADKQQLWSMILMNPQPQTLELTIGLTVIEHSTGQPVFTATTRTFLLPQGTKQLSSAQLNPIQYTSLNPSYKIDPGPTGLLPFGSFNLCYNFQIAHNSDLNKMIQECEQLVISPISPPLLTSPINGSTIEDINPLFSWLPPAPINLFNNLQYNFKLVEIYPGQCAADAIQQNTSFFSSQNITMPNLMYTSSSPELQMNKKYAWQIIASNNYSKIAESEIWFFKIKDTIKRRESATPYSSFIRLSNQGSDEGYTIFQGFIRLHYLNEPGDTTWNILLKDLSIPQSKDFTLEMENIPLKKGQNLVEYDASKDSRFINKHQYLLHLFNSRNEIWKLKFEYRKPD